MSNSRERAAGLLTHYMRTAFEAAGLHWDSDNTSEMHGIVDALHGMVLDEVREHTEETPHLYPDGSR